MKKKKKKPTLFAIYGKLFETYKLHALCAFSWKQNSWTFRLLHILNFKPSRPFQFKVFYRVEKGNDKLFGEGLLKFEAVNASEYPTYVYGSKEDDNKALNSLSEIDIKGNQSREFLVTEIVKSLPNLSDSEFSSAREQLLREFLPDDICPLDAQLFTDTPNKINPVDPNDDSRREGAPIFTIEDGAFQDSYESDAKNNMELVAQRHDLPSVNQLLEAVLETGHQVGRLSVTAPDVPYKEMALHCETLQMGKQNKMSLLMGTQPGQENLFHYSLQNLHYEDEKPGNPFLDPDSSAVSQRPPVAPVPMQCITELQHHPNFFRLPASNPYDNFLKAAGC